MFGKIAVFLDGRLKGLERIDSLLKNLNHRDAPDVLCPRLAHAVQGRLILGHESRVLSSHHGEHGEDGDHRRQKTGAAHPPVKEKHQRQHGKKQGNRTHNIRQVVG